MSQRVFGAHHVSLSRVWAVARVRGVTACLLAIVMGVWILRHQNQLFRTPAWEAMHDIINGRADLVGWPILAFGVIGMLGLVLRRLWMGIVSCIGGILWFGWTGGFLWYANFTGDPNIAAILCLYAGGEYVYRLATIAHPPDSGQSDEIGW